MSRLLFLPLPAVPATYIATPANQGFEELIFLVIQQLFERGKARITGFFLILNL